MLITITIWTPTTITTIWLHTVIVHQMRIQAENQQRHQTIPLQMQVKWITWNMPHQTKLTQQVSCNNIT